MNRKGLLLVVLLGIIGLDLVVRLNTEGFTLETGIRIILALFLGGTLYFWGVRRDEQ